ncbi:MAG: hypothetical protein JXQ75_21210 [Phycisphaerae bacterium]|nr:hypothetical protein [Phycisphaerae bacterium]
MRREIGTIREELIVLVERLLAPQRMIAAGLIERHLGTRSRKRASSAFYLSRAEGGRTRLTYVPKKKLAQTRARTEAWRGYRGGVRRVRELAGRLVRLLGELGEAQADRGGRGDGSR